MATNEHILLRKKLIQAAQDGNDIYQKSIIVKTPPMKNISTSIWMDDIGTETDLVTKVTNNWDFLHLEPCIIWQLKLYVGEC